MEVAETLQRVASRRMVGIEVVRFARCSRQSRRASANASRTDSALSTASTSVCGIVLAGARLLVACLFALKCGKGELTLQEYPSGKENYFLSGGIYTTLIACATRGTIDRRVTSEEPALPAFTGPTQYPCSSGAERGITAGWGKERHCRSRGIIAEDADDETGARKAQAAGPAFPRTRPVVAVTAFLRYRRHRTMTPRFLEAAGTQ